MLIFLSLGVIIFILAKYYPQLKEDNKQKALELNKKSQTIKKKILGLFLGIISAVKDFLVLIAEKTVKKTKELLYLIHFWLIKIKKKKKNGKPASVDDEFLGEIEAKEELIKEEEKNLDKIIHEDLGSSQQDDFVEEARKKIEEKQAVESRKEEIFEEKYSEDKIAEENFISSENNIENKAENFFGGEEYLTEKNWPEQEELKTADTTIKKDVEVEKSKISSVLSFPKKIFKIFSRKKKNLTEEKEQIQEKDYYGGDEFSDGIVKIEEYEKPIIEESLLIKEVVKIDKDRDLDEEIGIDRQILEKKLINKIVQNPKQIENYRQLGELYVKMENYAEAGECYQQILKIRARDVDARRKIEKIKLLKRIKK